MSFLKNLFEKYGRRRKLGDSNMAQSSYQQHHQQPQTSTYRPQFSINQSEASIMTGEAALIMTNSKLHKLNCIRIET